MADFGKIQNFDSDFDFDENFIYDKEVSVLISETDLFGEILSNTIYVGSSGQSQKYLGVRTENQLYVGSGNLWP